MRNEIITTIAIAIFAVFVLLINYCTYFVVIIVFTLLKLQQLLMFPYKTE